MGNARRAIFLAVFVTVAIGAGVVAVSSSSNPALTTNEVIISCGVLPNQQVDPILKYNGGQSAHLHTPSGAAVFTDPVTGNPTSVFSDSTTVAEMQSATSTSCLVASDHTEFWFPTFMTAAGAVASIKSQSYFLTNQDFNIPTSVPLGLRFIAGDSACNNTACDGNVIYQCAGSQATLHTIPTSCPAGNGFNESIYSQIFCWDGQSLGAGMGDSTPPNIIGTNLVRGTDGVCPDGFSAVPGVGWTIHVGQDGVGGFLSSDVPINNTAPGKSGTTGHLDFAFGQGALAQIITSCLDLADPGTGGTLQTCTQKPNGDGTDSLYALDSTGHYTIFVTR